LLWKKGEDIIAVGKQLINREDKRLQVRPIQLCVCKLVKQSLVKWGDSELVT